MDGKVIDTGTTHQYLKCIWCISIAQISGLARGAVPQEQSDQTNWLVPPCSNHEAPGHPQLCAKFGAVWLRVSNYSEDALWLRRSSKPSPSALSDERCGSFAAAGHSKSPAVRGFAALFRERGGACDSMPPECVPGVSGRPHQSTNNLRGTWNSIQRKPRK